MPLRIWSSEWFSTTKTSSLVTGAWAVRAGARCATGVSWRAPDPQAPSSTTSAAAEAAVRNRSRLTPRVCQGSRSDSLRDLSGRTSLRPHRPGTSRPGPLEGVPQMRRTRTTQVLAVATASAAIAALTLTSNAAAVTSSPTDATASPGSADSRVGAIVTPTRAQVDAVSAAIRSSPGTRATWDARFGTPRTLTPALGRTLSGPRAGTALDIAKAWVATHRAMLGLSAADVAALRLRRDHALPG